MGCYVVACNQQGSGNPACYMVVYIAIDQVSRTEQRTKSDRSSASYLRLFLLSGDLRRNRIDSAFRTPFAPDLSLP